MPRPSLTWLITDTHFYHDALVELCGRPANFTELIQKHWRIMVAAQDEVIHLGDVILYKYPELLGMMEALPGRKVLVMGNHDHKSRHWYMRKGFHCAVDMLVINQIIFTHKPLSNLSSDIKYNVHGHVHLNTEYQGKQSWHRPLSLERTGYKPIPLLSLIKDDVGNSHIAP